MKIICKILLGLIRLIYILFTALPFFTFMSLYVLGGGDMRNAFLIWMFWIKGGENET